jgi:two-component system, sensor histidine kinase and response regulator
VEEVPMSSPAQRETIVVIDDDYAMRLSCRKILEKSGFQVETFEDGVQGLEGVARLKPGLVVVDLKMPGMSGLEVISRVHAIDPDIILVVITGYATIDTAVEAMKSGAYDFLPKPFSPEELRLIVNRGFERRRLVLESRQYEVERALLKRRFVTFVSHQLQTPLVAVHQYLDVLKHLGGHPDVAVKREEWIDRCLQRIEAMQVMVKEWLELSAVESEALARSRDQVDLKGVIADIFAAYQPQAEAVQVSLESNLPEGGCWVAGDRHCVAVLFDNLVANAIKYNRPGGKVKVAAKVQAGEVSVSVADTGIGIPEKYIPFVFDEFFRVRDEATRNTSGSGLGLAICRKITAEMGGNITVESRVNTGSVFRVNLPAWRQKENSAA